MVVLFVVSAVDYVTNPLLKRVEVHREMNSKFSLGVENVVTLKVINRSRYPLKVRLKDDFPNEFLFDAVVHDCSVSPMDHVDISYRLTAVTAGNLSVRRYTSAVSGDLGTCRPATACVGGDGNKSLSEPTGGPTI